MATVHTVPTIQLPAPWSDAAVVVVVPTYNEASNIEEALGRLGRLPLPNLRVLVVDDGSPDGTADVAEAYGKRLGDQRPGFVTIMRRTSKDGLGRAYVAGMTEALAMGAEYVVQMDADLSHQPEYIPQLLGVILSTTAGVVIGSRYVPGGSLADEWKFHRRLLSGWANFYVNAVLGLGVRDATAGFKLWRRELLERLGLDQLTSAGYSFQVEMNYLSKKARYPIVEVPIHFEERRDGVSKMSLGEKLESAKVPFVLRFRHRG
ncbi:MAG: polyprenol monophosphomannose synthase [Dactylosporangium sp.]|nr:polyprenol monophosphomannose synthase [Dactylosporangium sp.]NNJ60910.1 polyprenol monophosphomannose synthase [Dactylosporangium sp.]